MQRLPTILLILSFPAGVVGYLVGAALVTALPLSADIAGVLDLFIPLLVAGLFMVPFLIKFFDQKARQDLAAYRAYQASQAASPKDGEPPR